MLMAALTLAYFGLLRCSEFTSPKVDQFDSTTLTRGDIHLEQSGRYLKVRIKASKTDPFRVGATVTIPKLRSRICPVAFMANYIRNSKDLAGPLFRFQNGEYLTREYISNLLTESFSGINLNTHSLRIGGATLLSKHGVPEHVIQKIGRWTSDCSKKYIRLSSQHIKDAYIGIQD